MSKQTSDFLNEKNIEIEKTVIKKKIMASFKDVLSKVIFNLIFVSVYVAPNIATEINIFSHL